MELNPSLTVTHLEMVQFLRDHVDDQSSQSCGPGEKARTPLKANEVNGGECQYCHRQIIPCGVDECCYTGTERKHDCKGSGLSPCRSA